MGAIEPDGPAAVRIAVRVSPGASRDAIAGLIPAPGGDRLRVRVSAPPEDGRANDALCALLARALGLRPSAARVVVGPTSRDKVVRVEGVGAHAARDAILHQADQSTADRSAGANGRGA